MSDSEKDEDELKPTTIFDYMKDLIKSALYSITDIETFQPKRKKSKIFYRTYRLVGIKSTTPEELYARKIEIEVSLQTKMYTLENVCMYALIMYFKN